MEDPVPRRSISIPRYRIKVRKRGSLNHRRNYEQNAYNPDQTANFSSQPRRCSSDFSLRQATASGDSAPSTPIIVQEPFAAETSQTSVKSNFPNPKLFPHLNLALGLSRDGRGSMSLNATNGGFPSFLESPAGNGPVQRQAPSPMQQGQQGGNNGVNGVGQGMNGMGMGLAFSAGQQMDVNMVYQRLMELSEVLKDNREKTQGIVAGAEELAVSTDFLLYE
ncbi:hypothetical protein MMC26_005764 [Xylographa opegraphella]|nr:hypothetical protein [Xylographa opegraphella]